MRSDCVAASGVFLALFNETDGLWLPRCFHNAFHHGTFSDGDGLTRDGSGYSGSLGDFDLPGGDYVAFDMAGNYDIVGPDRALPKAITCQRYGTLDLAIAIDLSADLVVSLARNYAGNLAAGVDQGRCAWGKIANTSTLGIIHAVFALEERLVAWCAHSTREAPPC